MDQARQEAEVRVDHDRHRGGAAEHPGDRDRRLGHALPARWRPRPWSAGSRLAKAVELGAQALLIDAANRSSEAAIAGVTSGFARRGEEWVNQLTLAEREIRQVEKQIEAAQRPRRPRRARPREPRAADRERALGARLHGAEVHQRRALPVDGRPAVHSVLPELPAGVRPGEAGRAGVPARAGAAGGHLRPVRLLGQPEEGAAGRGTPPVRPGPDGHRAIWRTTAASTS